MKPGSLLVLRRVRVFAPFCALISVLMVVACSEDSPSKPEQKAAGASFGESPGCPDVYADSCIVPQSFMLCGRGEDGSYDPLCEYKVTVRNASGNPIPNLEVKLKWSEYQYPGRPICVPTSPPVPGMSYSKVGSDYILTNTTDAAGIAHFRLAGGFAYRPPENDCESWWLDGPPFPVGDVYVCGQNLPNWETGTLKRFCVSTPNLDNSPDGVGAGDLSLFVGDFYCETYHPRSDFDGDQVVSAADLSILVSIIFGSGSVNGTCP